MANTRVTKAGDDIKTALVTTQNAKITTMISQISGAEVGRGLPDTNTMQGTTREFVPNRVLLSD